MLKLILRKTGQGLLVIWGIVTVLFLIFNLLGDPLSVMAGEKADVKTKAAIAKAYHLDRSLPVQYLLYLNDLSPIGLIENDDPDLDQQSYVKLFSISAKNMFCFKWPYMRKSFITHKNAASMIMEKLPGTIILAFAAMLLATPFGIFFGMVSAMKKDRFLDRFISVITLLGVSAPSFIVAVLLIRIFAVNLGSTTGFHITGYIFEENIFSDGYHSEWKNLVLPAIALGIRPLSVITQLTRTSMIEVLGSDYIRTARSKGLKERVVIMKHGLRNALIPVITSVSGWLASLLAGAFFVEAIFDWQGVGKLSVDALYANDYPLILAACIFTGVAFVIINTFIDISYSWIDPRIRKGN